MTHRKSSEPPDRQHKHWSTDEVRDLKRLAPTTPAPLIADRVGRSESAITSKASEENISFGKPNRSPDKRRQK